MAYLSHCVKMNKSYSSSPFCDNLLFISTFHIENKLIAREMVITPRIMVAAVDIDSLFITGVIFLAQKLLRYYPELF